MGHSHSKKKNRSVTSPGYPTSQGYPSLSPGYNSAVSRGGGPWQTIDPQPDTGSSATGYSNTGVAYSNTTTYMSSNGYTCAPSGIQTLAPQPLTNTSSQEQQPYVGFQPPPQPQVGPMPTPQPLYYQNTLIPPEFANFFASWNISSYFWLDIMSLSAYDICIIADDSGSMNTTTEPHTGKTRWDELKDMICSSVTLGGCLDKDGIDLIFLNRGTMRGVSNVSQITKLLENKPTQYDLTPLSSKLREALSYAKPEKPQLILIATDGVPYTGNTATQPDSVELFCSVLKYERRPNTYVSILKCSENPTETAYLDAIDTQFDNLNVIDDYESELEQIHRNLGPGFVYTRGDNNTRALLGAIFPVYDKMDGF